MTTSFEECAGARGLRLSSIEIVRYLSHLRHGAIIDPADLATMDKLQLGWDEKAPNAWAGTFWHAGDLLPADNKLGAPPAHLRRDVRRRHRSIDDRQLTAGE